MEHQQAKSKSKLLHTVYCAARYIPQAVNKKYAKHLWCQAAIQYLKTGRKA